MFEDTQSIILPELEVSKTITRNTESEYISYRYTYFNSRVMDIDEFINLFEAGEACLDTSENIEFFKNDGITLSMK